MRIQKDTDEKIRFVRSDEEQAKGWDRLGDAAQFMEDQIVLTSPAAGSGMLYLKNSARIWKSVMVITVGTTHPEFARMFFDHDVTLYRR
nr:hypothetical protein [Brevibacillus formosus]